MTGCQGIIHRFTPTHRRRSGLFRKPTPALIRRKSFSARQFLQEIGTEAGSGGAYVDTTTGFGTDSLISVDKFNPKRNDRHRDNLHAPKPSRWQLGDDLGGNANAIQRDIHRNGGDRQHALYLYGERISDDTRDRNDQGAVDLYATRSRGLGNYSDMVPNSFYFNTSTNTLYMDLPTGTSLTTVNSTDVEVSDREQCDPSGL